MTSDDIIINSTKFSVDKNGKMTCSDANITSGTIQLEGGTTDFPNLMVYNNQTYTKILPNGLWSQTGIIYLGYGSASQKSILQQGSLRIIQDYPTESDSTEISGGTINTVVVYQRSLESSKKNFEKFENALDKIKNIDIYKYNMKHEDDGTKKHLGFVIGDKYKYVDDITSPKNDNVDLYSFISLCCQGIKEQQEQIEQLQKEIKELKGEK